MTTSDIDKTEDIQKKYPHLKMFKKGQSGNPNGRPKGSVSITTEIKNKLLKVFPEKIVKIDKDGKKIIIKRKKTYLDKVIETIFETAIKDKDPRTLNQIWAYIDGHPKATVDIGVDKDSIGELTEFFRNIAKSKKEK